MESEFIKCKLFQEGGIMKVKKIILGFLAMTIVFSGCNKQTTESMESKNNSTAIDKSEVTTLPTATTYSDDEKSVEYAEANYFKERVDKITYYRNGKSYNISPNTENGKQVILMTMQRYVNTAEQPLKKNELKNKVVDLKKQGKALEILFDKYTKQSYEGGELNDFQNVLVDFQGWFYPLEGNETEYFTPLPNQECTFRRLGSPEQLLDFLEKHIINN